MQQTGCTKILFAAELAPLARALEFSERVELFEVPSFSDMIDVKAETFPYEETFEEAVNNPIVVLHSSGSTGEAYSYKYAKLY